MNIWQTGIPERIQAQLVREHVEAMSDAEVLKSVRGLLMRAAYELIEKGGPADRLDHEAIDALKNRVDRLIFPPKPPAPEVVELMWTLRRDDGEPIDGDEAQWLVAKPEGWEESAAAYVDDEPVAFVLETWACTARTHKLIGPEK